MKDPFPRTSASRVVKQRERGEPCRATVTDLEDRTFQGRHRENYVSPSSGVPDRLRAPLETRSSVARVREKEKKKAVRGSTIDRISTFLRHPNIARPHLSTQIATFYTVDTRTRCRCTPDIVPRKSFHARVDLETSGDLNRQLDRFERQRVISMIRRLSGRSSIT